MIVKLQHKLDIGTSEWSNESFSSISWVSHANRWEATFFTNEETIIGNYSFRAQIIDKNSGASNFIESETFLEILNRPPNAVISVSENKANEDEEILFDSANSSDPEDFVISSVHWDFGDGGESTAFKVHHSYPRSGAYNITLTVMDKNFATTTAHLTITIQNVQPVADFKVTTGTATVKVGQSIIFDGSNSFDTDSDKMNLTYHWDFDDGNTSDQVNTTHIYTKPGTYIITFTVKDDDGSKSTKIRDLNIQADGDLNGDKDDGKETVPWYETQNLFYLILIIIIVVLLILVLVLKRRKDKAKEEIERSLGVGKKGKVGKGKRPAKRDTLVTDIYEGKPVTEELDKVDIPTIEPEVAEIIEPKKKKALPQQTIAQTQVEDIDTDEKISEVEVEFVPEVKAVGLLDVETPATTTNTGEGVDVHLPLAIETDEYEDYEDEFAVDLPEPGSEPVEDSEFVPPEIDLSGIMEPEVEPAQPHRKEISDAKQRGAGINFDFKKPDEKKKKHY
jgi:PKD repeat protein